MGNIEQRVQATFKYLHRHAEISWEETETTEYIADILRKNNCRVTTFSDCTGVIGYYGNFKRGLPIVAIRADMDALWQEVDGRFQANHSCGHDAHMAMILGVLWTLQKNPHLKEKIALRFIFQPAEEDGTGALKMVEKGVVNDVDYLYGIHLRPIQEMKLGDATPVIVHGATRNIRAEIIGEDAHGARPHLNQNAIEIGAQIVSMLSHIHLDPRVPSSVKMTSFQAGGKSANIIPGSAHFALDLRSQTNQLMTDLEEKVFHIFNTIQTLYNIEIKVTENMLVPAAETNDEAISVMEQAIQDVLGVNRVQPPLLTPGGDDFHFYTIKKPELKATMLGLGANLKPGLHHPKMMFDLAALMDGVNILYRAILRTYNIESNS